MRTLFGKYCNENAQFYDEEKGGDRVSSGEDEDDEEESEEVEEQMTLETVHSLSFSNGRETQQSTSYGEETQFVDCATQIRAFSQSKGTETEGTDDRNGMESFNKESEGRAQDDSSNGNGSSDELRLYNETRCDDVCSGSSTNNKWYGGLNQKTTGKVSKIRRAAYKAALGTIEAGRVHAGMTGTSMKVQKEDDGYENTWAGFGGLVCAGNNHDTREVEL